MRPLTEARSCALGRRTRRSFMLATGAVVTSITSRAFSQAKPVKQATITFFAEINNQTMNQLITAWEKLIKEEVSEVFLNISSGGGNVEAAVSAHDWLRSRPLAGYPLPPPLNSGGPVKGLTTHNFGVVDSSAVLLFALGNHRYSTANGRFLIHSPFIQNAMLAQVRDQDANEMSGRLRQETEAFARILATSTGKPHDEALGWLRDRAVWTPEDAKRNGFIDDIKDLVVHGDVVSIASPNPEPTQQVILVTM